MNGVIGYLNTDLDLISSADLTRLAAAFEAGGVDPLSDPRPDDEGKWWLTFEANAEHSEPEPHIAVMLDVIESLSADLRTVWNGCSRREFNIGYDCGLEPWAFNQGLSPQILGRMAAVGASLRWTLYPDREPQTMIQASQRTSEA